MQRLLLALWILAAAAPATAQTAEKLAGTVDETIATARNTQQLKDAWSAEKTDLENRYHVARSNVEWLRQRIDVESQRAAALDHRVHELQRQIQESSRLQEVIQDSMIAVLCRLERSVDASIPFLTEERGNRVRFLRGELAKPEVDPAEKLRRLLEALLIEAQYGRTVEVIQERIVIGEVQKFVDMLRIGRLALIWRTPEGTQIGTWDPVTESHVLMPDRHKRTVQRAMEMATRMRPVQLLSLPIGRIEP